MGQECDFALKNITERGGTIRFNAYFTHVLTGVIIPESITLGYGTSAQLTPTLVPENAPAKLTWTSDNTAVATVSTTGKVTAKSAGTAVITATAKDGSGVKATCTVTVKATVNTGEVNISGWTEGTTIGGGKAN